MSICSMKMRTLKKLSQRILLISSLALFYNEFLIYYLVLSTCGYPAVPQGSHIGAMVLADTHLLGARNGHWFDKLRREWQMHRTFQTAQTIFRPEHVFFLVMLICLLFIQIHLFQVTCLMKENGVLQKSLIIM